ncbi:hypothetical protein VTH06DRAFT_3917 [Thermothelomyces fergusii]
MYSSTVRNHTLPRAEIQSAPRFRWQATHSLIRFSGNCLWHPLLNTRRPFLFTVGVSLKKQLNAEHMPDFRFFFHSQSSHI